MRVRFKSPSHFLAGPEGHQILIMKRSETPSETTHISKRSRTVEPEEGNSNAPTLERKADGEDVDDDVFEEQYPEDTEEPVRGSDLYLDTVCRSVMLSDILKMDEKAHSRSTVLRSTSTLRKSAQSPCPT